jgi:hypothetical protein
MPINPNAAVVAQHLREKLGLSNAQIAGVLGNFSQESGLNSRINEGGAIGAPSGRGGYGLAQWTGERQANLVSFAKQRKMDPGDPVLQSQFLVSELQGPEKAALQSLRGAVSPEQSALVFRRDFERAGDPNDANRLKQARALYGQLGQTQAPKVPLGVNQTTPSVNDTLLAALGFQLNPLEQTPKSTSFAADYLDKEKQKVLQQLFMPGGIPGLDLPGVPGLFASTQGI